MRRFWLGVALLAAWLLAVPPARAQSNPTIVINGVDVDRSRVATAARPLIDAGARVVVVATNSGGTPYLDDQLQELGIADSSDADDLPSDVLIFYVSVSPRESGVLFGRNFQTELNGQTSKLRDTLNARLRAGDFTGGFVDVMRATATTIDNPVAARTEPASTTSSSSSGSGFVTLLVVGLLAVGGFFLARMFFKRNAGESGASGDALAQTRQRFEGARKQAGAVIADLGQLMKDARAKQQFDKVSYPKTQIQELETRHKDAEARFHQLQVQFDDIEERIQALPAPTVIDLEGAAGGYDGVKAQAQQVLQALQEMDALRKQLDAISAQAPAEVDRAKKF
ncbi:MAG TPA: hypothetical protein VGE07_01725 [Herpetosiphonaceae bacterium]